MAGIPNSNRYKTVPTKVTVTHHANNNNVVIWGVRRRDLINPIPTTIRHLLTNAANVVCDHMDHTDLSAELAHLAYVLINGQGRHEIELALEPFVSAMGWAVVKPF